MFRDQSLRENTFVYPVIPLLVNKSIFFNRRYSCYDLEGTMKFPLRAIGAFIAGFIALVAYCAAQTAGVPSSGQTNPAPAETTQSSEAPAKAAPAVSQAPRVTTDVPRPVR